VQQRTTGSAVRLLLLIAGVALSLAMPASADTPPGIDFSWGVLGTQPGELQHPRSFARALDGTVWVLNTGTLRMEHFTREGAFLGDWPLPPIDFGDQAVGMAIDSSNQIYVTNWFAHVVHVFNPGGVLLREFGNRTTAGDARGIAVLPDGTCLVVNDERVSVFNPAGDFVGAIGVGHLSRPWDIAVDESGNLYVTDLGKYDVVKLDSAGNYLTEWPLVSPGQLVMGDPTGIVVRNGTVAVADDRYGRLIAFDTEGQFSWQVTLPGSTEGSDDAIDVAMDGAEGYFVLGPTQGRVFHLGPMSVPAISMSWGRLKSSYK
jgi:tripartite motif-containing protein 71